MKYLAKDKAKVELAEMSACHMADDELYCQEYMGNL